MQVKYLVSSILVAHYPLGPDFESDGFEECWVQMRVSFFCLALETMKSTLRTFGKEKKMEVAEGAYLVIEPTHFQVVPIPVL